jgi:Sec-independent protein secretion pathway component TatC
MKEFVGWLAWIWRNWEPWQKLWIVACAFLGGGITASPAIKPYLLAVPVSIFFFFTAKWLVWDAFKASWAKYKTHRNELLTTIKQSDQ